MTGTDKDSFLICEVQERLFALPLTCIERVVRAVEILALPHSSSALLGVINVQGRTVSVINTYFYFDLPSREIEPEDFLILLRVSQQIVALPANRVLEVVSGPSLHNANAPRSETTRDFTAKNALTLSDDVRIWNSQMVWLIDLPVLLQTFHASGSQTNYLPVSVV